MSNRIYRGKRIEYGEWVHGYLIGDDIIVGNIVEFTDEYFNTSFWYKVDPKTVGQYTGFKDKNSKEIYEDDLFKSGRSVGAIKFEDGQYLIIWRGHTDWNNLLYVHAPHGEVVGNINDEVRSWGRNERQSKAPQESQETS